MAANEALVSIVKNISGGRLHFGFLPPHGVTLNAGQEYVIYGDVRQEIMNIKPHQLNARRIKAFVAATAGPTPTLQIMQTPSPVIRDSATGAPKELHSSNGTLSTVAPAAANASDTLDDTSVGVG